MKEKKPAGAMTPSLAGHHNSSYSAVTDSLCYDRWKSLKPWAKISNASSNSLRHYDYICKN